MDKVRVRDVTINKRLLYVALVSLLASACAASKKRNERDNGDLDGRVSDSSGGSMLKDAGDRDVTTGVSGDSSASGTGELNGAGGTGGTVPTMYICGNGRVEGEETCDDGNVDSRDGCTPQCEFSCVDDTDCDDLNDCNGIEICTKEGACDDSDPSLEEGAVCDQDKSCWQGVCVSNVCGDNKRDPGEACDDGNLDPDDGCTPDCELTCEINSDCANQDACLGNRLCRDDGQHNGLRVCRSETRLEDRTACEIKDANTKTLCGDLAVDKDGWCMRGVCTCAGCGDGEVNETEACDDGALNGTAASASNCSLNCQVTSCGNGVLEGDEECDDGNSQSMDGCDAGCRYEFAHRFTHLELLKEVDVPKWCKYRNNRFAEAFVEEVPIDILDEDGRIIEGLFVTYNSLEIINRQFGAQTASSDAFYVLSIIDSNDTSMKTVDRDITLGLYRGYPRASNESALDQRVIIDWNRLDRDTLLPAEYHSVPAIQAGGGRVLSRAPTVVEIDDVAEETVLIHDFMLQLVFDLSTLARPNVEPLASRDSMATSETLRVPEVATGLFCGTIGKEYAKRPISHADFRPGPRLCCKNRGDDIGSSYQGCDNGVLTDQCDSVGDLIRQGCDVCIDIDSVVNDWNYSGDPCELMRTDPASCFTFINGVEYDVDSDGDGENDSWSALFGFETERIRIYDVAER